MSDWTKLMVFDDKTRTGWRDLHAEDGFDTRRIDPSYHHHEYLDMIFAHEHDGATTPHAHDLEEMVTDIVNGRCKTYEPDGTLILWRQK